MENYQCIYEGKIATIETNLNNLDEKFDKFIENDFHEIQENIKCITNRISKPRLPIYITWLLTGCSALITGLIITLVK